MNYYFTKSINEFHRINYEKVRLREAAGKLPLRCIATVLHYYKMDVKVVSKYVLRHGDDHLLADSKLSDGTNEDQCVPM
jgi:hypothetical protein